MKTFTLVVELRHPRNAEERKLAGLCVTEDRLVSRIFLNALQPAKDLADTFFHEMAHAYMHWRGYKRSKRQEKLAHAVGKAAEAQFRRISRG